MRYSGSTTLPRALSAADILGSVVGPAKITFSGSDIYRMMRREEKESMMKDFVNVKVRRDSISQKKRLL
jgi:hypothetical protein